MGILLLSNTFHHKERIMSDMERRDFLKLLGWTTAGIMAYQPMESLGQTPPLADEALSGKVAPYHGRPTLYINNHPVAPMIYALTEGGRFTWEETPHRNLENFTKAGYRLFQVDVWFRDIWKPDDSLDMPTVRHQVRAITEVCPEAAVFIRIHVDPPQWWLDRHPGETVAYANAVNPGVANARSQESLASTLWLNDATRQLETFCRELAPTPEGRHVVGLHLAGGLYGEWHYWNFDLEPDTSPTMTSHFRYWLEKKYGADAALRRAWNDPTVTLATADVPGLQVRDRTLGGFFRDPVRERQVIDYYTCQQDLVADDVIHFCHTARAAWPRPLITGAFFGYFHTMTEMGMPDAMQGDFERVLDSKDIDYLSGPMSYETDTRAIGGSGMFRSLTASVRLHGKLWLSEMDQASLFGNPFDMDPRMWFHTLSDNIAGDRRNFAFALTSGMGQWWYDFGPKGNGGWWDQPQLMEEAGAMLRLYQAALKKPWHPVADVLLVYDLASYDYQTRTVPINEQCYKDPLSHPLAENLAEAAYHTGAAVDQVALPDLPWMDLSHYKVVVFGNVWRLTDAQRAFIRDHVLRDGRTVIWQYAPGITDGKTLMGAADISSVVGMTLKSVTVTGTSQVQLAPHPPANFVGLKLDYGITGEVHPLFAVEDNKSQTIGQYTGTGDTALAIRHLARATVVYSGLPITQESLLRAIFRLAGAHIYDEEPDVILADNNYVCIHTLSGGDRKIVLRDGKAVSVKLSPRSTVILDAVTGDSVLPDKAKP